MDSNSYDYGNVVVFYEYYSTFTLCIAWMLAPVTFHVMFTQSDTLGPVKWFFLNHSFWCLMLETVIGIVKPVLLGEIAAGYSVGLFRNTDFKSSAIGTMLGFLFIIYGCCGLALTIMNRYATVFNMKSFKTRKSLIIIVIVYIVGIVLCFAVILPILFMDEEQIHLWAREYDMKLVRLFDKPTFFIVPQEVTDTYAIVGIIAIFGVIAVCVGIAITFISSLISVKSSIHLNKKLQRSILLSALIQMSLTVCFLFLPLFIFMIFLRFHIRDSGKWVMILMCVFTSHCFLDFIATLYFVTPYRNFVIKMLSWKKQSETVVIHPSMASTRITNTRHNK